MKRDITLQEDMYLNLKKILSLAEFTFQHIVQARLLTKKNFAPKVLILHLIQSVRFHQLNKLLFLILFLITFKADLLAAKIFNAKYFSLDNGLRVVVVENKRAPVVTQMLWYNVGSIDEEYGKSGLAHFMEHLMFKGTKNFLVVFILILFLKMVVAKMLLLVMIIQLIIKYIQVNTLRK